MKKTLLKLLTFLFVVCTVLSVATACNNGTAPDTNSGTNQTPNKMEIFEYISTSTTCEITGVKDKTITSITIPDCVTSIGDYAFGWCPSLTSIEIPSSVTSIGDSAFYHCDSLTSIAVEKDNLKYKSIDGNLYSKDGKTLIQYAIGKAAKTFSIPNSVTKISASAFDNCDSLTSIEIPNSVTSIGDLAFYWCSSLTSIEIPNSVTSIGNGAFVGCDSLNYNVKDGLKYLGNESNKYLYLAYTESDSITTVNIDSGCRFIREYAFSNCSSLTSIVIPNSVTSIGSDAFSGCSSLKYIYCEAESRPSGWNSYWISGCSATVVLGYKG